MKDEHCDSKIVEEIREKGKTSTETKYAKPKAPRRRNSKKPNQALPKGNRNNDPNWYFESSVLAEQAASISFNQYQGLPFQIPQISADGSKFYTVRIPSIYKFNINPSAGETANVNSGINIAALRTYSTLSSRNAKTTGYAPQDVTMLLLALGNIISTAEFLRRAFGTAFTYNVRNRDLPRELLRIQNINADDFLQHLADYRLQFNSIITAINKIPFPSNIAYLFKCADIYQHVYLDGTSDMSAVVVMCPASVWTFDEAYSDQGSGLRTTAIPTSTQAFSAWLQLLSSQVTAIMESSTFNYIYSDVLNYADRTGAKLLYLDYLTEDYAVVPEYNENFMLQIHNSTVMGTPNGTAAAGITASNDVAPNADKNKVDYFPQFPIVEGVNFAETIIDFPTPTASTTDIIEATRFTALPFLGSGTVTTQVAIPDHYVTSVARTRPGLSYGGLISSWSSATDSAGNLGDIDVLTDMSHLDWAPILYYVHDDTTVSVAGDLNYYTTVGFNWLMRVNDLTFQSLFNLR
nr:putative capsid [Marmot picobirnavirus]